MVLALPFLAHALQLKRCFVAEIDYWGLKKFTGFLRHAFYYNVIVF